MIEQRMCKNRNAVKTTDQIDCLFGTDPAAWYVIATAFTDQRCKRFLSGSDISVCDQISGKMCTGPYLFAVCLCHLFVRNIDMVGSHTGNHFFIADETVIPE